MSKRSLREKIQSEVQATGAAELLPHHRRGALFIVQESTDILDVALAIAQDLAPQVQAYLAAGEMRKPELSELSDWCVDSGIRLQYIILQPYVLAQTIRVVDKSLS